MNRLFLVVLLALGLVAPMRVTGAAYVKYFNTLAEMLAANPNDLSKMAFVNSMTGVTGDDGAAFFYNSSSVLATNTTSVFKPISYSGRWIRVAPMGNGYVTEDGINTFTADNTFNGNLLVGSTNVAVKLSYLESRSFLPTAEMFGGVANDGTDDYSAITNCLATYGTIELGPGEYITSKQIVMEAGQSIFGKGKFLTTLTYQTNSTQFAALGSWYKLDGVITTPVDGGGASVQQTNINLQDFTLDCNYDGQTTPPVTNTICGVVLYGTGHTIKNVRVLDWGSGVHSHALPNYREAFGIVINGDAATTGLDAQSVIDGCEARINYTIAGGPGDISSIVIWQDNGSGVIRNCYVADLPNGSIEPNACIAYTAYGKNVTIENNVAARIMGYGVHLDSFTNVNVVIRNNVFDETVKGVNFGASYFTNVVIEGNFWRNPQSIPAAKAPPAGIDLTDYRYPNGVCVRGAAVVDGLYIRNNTFTATEWSDNGTVKQGGPCIAFYPQSSYEHWTNIVVADNILSLASTNHVIANLSRLPWWVMDNHRLTNGTITWSNNRNKDGGIQYLQERDWAGTTQYSLTDNTATFLKASGLATPPTNHAQIWYNYTNRNMMITDDTGVQRVISRMTNSVDLGKGNGLDTVATGNGLLWLNRTNNNLMLTDPDGIQRIVNQGTNWVDSMVPGLAVAPGGTAPSLSVFAGGSLYVYQFNDGQDDHVYFTVQLNHNYKQGTDIHPHVHWAQSTVDTTDTVVWRLNYSWANVDGTFSPASSILMTNTISGTQWKHQMDEFPTITGTGKTVSSILACELIRLANTSGSDNYNGDAAFLGFDIHYEIDTIGSSTEYAK